MSEGTVSPMRDTRGYLQPEEVKEIISHGRTFRDQVMMRVLWATGCRVTEMLMLTMADILWKEKTFIMWTLKRKQKNIVQRRVLVDAATLEILKNYCESVGIKKGRIFNLTSRRVEQIVYEAGKAAGISKVGTKKLHPHHFRHSHAVAWVRKNRTMEGLRKLQQRLGHTNITTTAHYLQFATGEQEAEVESVFGKW